MKVSQWILGSVVVLGMAAQSLGAEKAGNGGGAYYCRGPKENKRKYYDAIVASKKYGYETFELIDSWEARNRHHLAFNAVKGNTEQEIINALLQRVIDAGYSGLAADIKSALVEVEKRWTEATVKLNKVPDLSEIGYEDNCRYLQLANWDDLSDLIHVLPRVYKSPKFFALRGKLKFHEAVYYLDRTKNDTPDSDSARAFDSYVMSGNKVKAQFYTRLVNESVAVAPRVSTVTYVYVPQVPSVLSQEYLGTFTYQSGGGYTTGLSYKMKISWADSNCVSERYKVFITPQELSAGAQADPVATLQMAENGQTSDGRVGIDTFGSLRIWLNGWVSRFTTMNVKVYSYRCDKSVSGTLQITNGVPQTGDPYSGVFRVDLNISN